MAQLIQRGILLHKKLKITQSKFSQSIIKSRQSQLKKGTTDSLIGLKRGGIFKSPTTVDLYIKTNHMLYHK